MSEQIKARIRRFVEEGFNETDLDALDESYAQDCLRHVPPLADMHGVEALKKYALDYRRDVFSEDGGISGYWTRCRMSLFE